MVDASCDGYISHLDEHGNIEKVPVKYEDRNDTTIIKFDEGLGVSSLGLDGMGGELEAEMMESTFAGSADGNRHSIGDFIGADILAKPFNFVSGNATRRKRCNPFRKKKSGLLNVLAKQATRNRLVAKNGNINTLSQSEGKTHKFFKDVFITLLDLSWAWIFMVFATAFFSSWLLFASIWYLTMLQHGDFMEANRLNTSFKPCVTAIDDFTSCFLFSIETQHTIGYGTRYIGKTGVVKSRGATPLV